MKLDAGSVVAGRFRLARRLAVGGMGEVWEAFDTQLRTPVALKFMNAKSAGSADAMARFRREAIAAAQLRHPNVVQILEHGVHEGVPYIVMELLEGEDLAKRVRIKGRLSLAETSRILGDVCKALRRAHDMGLIHRDLKPANIFLCKHEEDEVVKVLDFGVAKWVDGDAEGNVTQTGMLLGSPGYMAPEQARRGEQPIDTRADLWSVGVIAFLCLTGKRAFAGDTALEVLMGVCTKPAPVPSSVAPDLGPEVDRFFARALARPREARFRTAKELADALAALAGGGSPSGEASSGRPPPPRHDQLTVRVNTPPRLPDVSAFAPPAVPMAPPRPAYPKSAPLPPSSVPSAQPPLPRLPAPQFFDLLDDDAATVPITHSRTGGSIAAQQWTAGVQSVQAPGQAGSQPPAAHTWQKNTIKMPPAPPPSSPGSSPGFGQAPPQQSMASSHDFGQPAPRPPMASSHDFGQPAPRPPMASSHDFGQLAPQSPVASSHDLGNLAHSSAGHYRAPLASFHEPGLYQAGPANAGMSVEAEALPTTIRLDRRRPWLLIAATSAVLLALAVILTAIRAGGAPPGGATDPPAPTASPAGAPPRF